LVIFALHNDFVPHNDKREKEDFKEIEPLSFKKFVSGMNRKLKLGAILFVALSYTYFVTSMCWGAVSLSVSPYLLELEVPGGGMRTFTLTLHNQGDEPAGLKVYTRSLHLSATGKAQPGETNEGIFSCAGWISLNPSEFTVEPGDKKKVTGILKVPRGQRGGRYACILFETVSKETKESIRISTRLGVVVMMTIPRTCKKEGEIVSFSSNPVEQGVSFNAIFRNTGNVHLKATSSIVIMDTEGKVVDRVNLQGGTGTVLPLEEREFSGTWTRKSKMTPGKEYTAEVRMMFPGGKWVRKKFEFVLPEKG